MCWLRCPGPNAERGGSDIPVPCVGTEYSAAPPQSSTPPVLTIHAHSPTLLPMKASPRVGTLGEFQFVVGQEHVIDFASDGMPAVLSTPKLIGLIERTSRQTLVPFLDKNERSVGIEIDLKHLAPTPEGHRVLIRARVVHAVDRSITFHVEARDEHELIARGLHKRVVIRVDSFSRRVRGKAGVPCR